MMLPTVTLAGQSKGDIPVICDGGDCLMRLKAALPRPAGHILDRFQIVLKLRLIERTALCWSRRLPADEVMELVEDVAAVRWCLGNGEADRALDLRGRLFHDNRSSDQGSIAIVQLRNGMLNLRTYIEQNRGSIDNSGCEISRRQADRLDLCRGRRQQPRCAADGQETADALVGTRGEPASSASRRPCQRRSCEPPRLPTAQKPRQTIISPVVPILARQPAASPRKAERSRCRDRTITPIRAGACDPRRHLRRSRPAMRPRCEWRSHARRCGARLRP
jgi:hypothetical protein